jgi:hypothetical protein
MVVLVARALLAGRRDHADIKVTNDAPDIDSMAKKGIIAMIAGREVVCRLTVLEEER